MVTKPKNGVAVFVIINELNWVHEDAFKLNRAVPLFVNKLGGANKVVRDSSELCTLVQKLYKEERDDLCPGWGHRWEVKNPTTIITGDLLVSSPNTINLKETDSMKNTKADNFIQDQKAIAKEIASLNAGRVSNKVVKEAMRPLVALLFKPTWMQKLAMKVTGAKNPLDEFMNTPYADLICAQLFKTAIDMRDVENAHVKKTANSAVIYAGLKVTEELPIEELIDKAIKQVTEATAQAVGKSE